MINKDEITTPLTYAAAGVDVDKGNALIPMIKDIAKSTFRTGVIGEIGGFGGLFSMNTASYERPVLVSSTDGVGTKLKIAFMMDKHDTVGIDLVAMSVNDIAVVGAKPLFFLDYIATGKLEHRVIIDVIKGVAEGCRRSNCSLIGGETAEMPGFYHDNEYDLVGFAVGVVDNQKIVDGTNISVGNVLIGVASDGLHSNGFSLVRKICFDVLKLKPDTYVDDLSQTLGECLLTPTRIYSELTQQLVKSYSIKGMAHITGGGITDKLARILPKACQAVVYTDKWVAPPIFSFLKKAGNVSDTEMLHTFNNGIGLIIVVPEVNAQEILNRLLASNEKAWIIGEIKQRQQDNEQQVVFKK